MGYNRNYMVSHKLLWSLRTRSFKKIPNVVRSIKRRKLSSGVALVVLLIYKYCYRISGHIIINIHVALGIRCNNNRNERNTICIIFPIFINRPTNIFVLCSRIILKTDLYLRRRFCNTIYILPFLLYSTTAYVFVINMYGISEDDW